MNDFVTGTTDSASEVNLISMLPIKYIHVWLFVLSVPPDYSIYFMSNITYQQYFL
jgi:hypothetical protein